MEAAVLDTLDPLIGALRERGYAVVGPTVRDGVIRFAELGSAADLPAGRADEQAPGVYRLHERGELVFGFAASPDSVKRWTHPPRSTLFRMRDGVPEPAPVEAPKVALLGVRACDLAALAVQDRVFLGGRHPDEAYRERRAALFLIAVTCAVPGGTCFCASLGTGPRASSGPGPAQAEVTGPRAASGPGPASAELTGPRTASGFDLALTELTGPHRFLAEAGSERGGELLAALPSRPAGNADVEAARAVGTAAEARMGRRVDLGGVKERLIERRESPAWNEIASRCLTCANCTIVCPTCFCVTVEDGTSLDDGTAERTERWDSCFTLEFTELGGAPVRSSGAARYRQWLTHKFSTWFDQFGTCGCVGCGRCVTWCPAGIDIVEELERLR